MTKKRFAILSGIGFLSLGCLFAIPNSVWYDTGSILARVLIGAGIVGTGYVLYSFVKEVE